MKTWLSAQGKWNLKEDNTIAELIFHLPFNKVFQLFTYAHTLHAN